MSILCQLLYRSGRTDYWASEVNPPRDLDSLRSLYLLAQLRNVHIHLKLLDVAYMYAKGVSSGVCLHVFIYIVHASTCHHRLQVKTMPIHTPYHSRWSDTWPRQYVCMYVRGPFKFAFNVPGSMQARCHEYVHIQY